jgi:hypothetical protein
MSSKNQLNKEERRVLRENGWEEMRHCPGHLKWTRVYRPPGGADAVRQVVTRAKSPSDERAWKAFVTSVLRMNDVQRASNAGGKACAAPRPAPGPGGSRRREPPSAATRAATRAATPSDSPGAAPFRASRRG